MFIKLNGNKEIIQDWQNEIKRYLDQFDNRVKLKFWRKSPISTVCLKINIIKGPYNMWYQLWINGYFVTSTFRCKFF